MSEHELLPIRVRLTAEDYAGFNRYHGRWQLFVLFLFYWGLFVVVATWSGDPKDASGLGLIIPGGALLGGLLIGLHLWGIQRRTRKLFENDKLAGLEQQFELTEEGIRHTTGGTTVNVGWADVYKASETSRAMIVYVARNNALVIPKRDIGDLPRFRETLRRHLPSAKQRFK